MQGKNNAIGSLPESVGSDLVPTSNDAAINQQIYWNNMWNSSHNLLPDYMTQPQGPGGAYQNSMSHVGPSLSGWNVGEASSSGTDTHVSLNERKAEHEWSSQMVSCGPVLEERQHEPVNILSLNNVNGNCNSNPIANVPLFMQSSSNATPKDLNTGAEFAGHDNGNSHIIDSPNSNKYNGSHKFWIPSASSSSDPFGTPSGTGGYLMEENDGRRSSCKRKALDGNNGQSSVGGSSSYFQQAESSVCHAVPGRYNAGSSLNISTPPENIFGVSPLERVNARLGLGVRGSRAASQSHRALNAAGNAESSHRNFRVRISASHQQDSVPINVFSNEGTAGNSNLLPQQQSSRFLPTNHSFDMRSPPAADNTNSHMQFTAANVPALRQTQHSSRWSGASSSRSGHSSASGVRDAVPHEESNSICMPTNIAEHPMFMPANEMRHLAQSSSNRSLTGENISITGNVSSANVASTSQTGSSTGLNQLYGPNSVPRRNPLQYPRRLSELVRRSLLSSAASESQSSNSPVLAGPSQEMELSSGARNQGHPLSHSRSAILLERQLEGTFGSPYSVRALAAASEGRGRLVSEIRSVLDLMRRGEGVRFEDLMILDQSVFFGLADVHDRHRDMRLDVDNMSYEELLALEERIGNVNTGLSAEIISKCLKQRKYFSIAMGARLEVEPCCVCQEEYNDSDDIGALDCGHEFHTNCIKKWLMQKNLCPICKTSALNK